MSHFRIEVASLFLVITLAFLCPRSHAQWIQTAGPEGAWVRQLAVSGSSLFAGTWGGGVSIHQ